MKKKSEKSMGNKVRRFWGGVILKLRKGVKERAKTRERAIFTLLGKKGLAKSGNKKKRKRKRKKMKRKRKKFFSKKFNSSGVI